MQIHLLILHASPEAFNKNVVSPRTPAINADSSPLAFNGLDKLKRSKLTALIGVDDLRRVMVHECFIENIHCMTGLKGNGNLRSQNFPAGPVHNRRQIEPLAIGIYVVPRAPHLVRLVDVHTAQQVSIDGVAGMFLARFWLWINSLYVHSFHQCAYASAANSFSFSDKLVTKNACAHERVL
ncbi:hypothetical protein SAMN05660330_03132 [Desulforhopalus singaporensis]|uniref:Uncharacterized protein n=1 Tax=Desulforhopalus singaporensis TaxID=91360 RepID=A0A1H0TKT7_9BACT|nr:hypothetical protein SAMN05660330_03132 [Desulforhopalus singaporensis]